MQYDFDFIVIGGGSGGIAAAKEAALLGARTAMLDFVKPSPHGNTWGLGGTCVNVGCIPKKLFHQAALLKHSISDAAAYGHQVPTNVTHDWATLMAAVRDYIGSLNFGYRVQVREKGIEYINAYGTFKDAHTLDCTDKKGKVRTITGKHILIAVGGRPKPLEIPGGEHAISSDDVFFLEKPPGKTLVVGASYVALECAGFLTGLGYDTSLMVRSIFLRGFDQQIAEMIGSYMAEDGTKILRNAVPQSIVKQEDGKLRVTYTIGQEKHEDVFDTVLCAVGRSPVTASLGLANVGIATDPHTGHIIVNDEERTSVDSVHAIGDCIKGGLELTPVAIMAGKLLANRLFGGDNTKMDYTKVATTVFTPLEYGAVGLSEEAAIEKFGDAVEVYHSYFQPLEFTVAHRPENQCYAKVIVNRDEGERILGMHILGPNAGEIIQGYGVAVKMGATKRDLERTVGIHPTVAEEFTVMNITKSSGVDAKKGGC
jgi:thioredoxin reductase (NADPH)